MIRHFADSVNPIMSSGEQTLIKGKLLILANWQANAVLPEFGGPSRRTVTTP